MGLTDDLLNKCVFPEPGTPVRLGVSGGADSSALLVLAVAAGCDVTAVHVDHGLRAGSESEADVVATTAERFGAAFVREVVVVAPGANLEARARHARHEVLGPDALLGHTADDRAETVLLHLLRGTGSDGLGALCPPDPRHPLLNLRRADTVALCESLGIDTVADPSNTDPRFARNRVRHEVLPLLRAVAGRDVVPLVCRMSDLIAADGRFLGELASQLDPTDAKAVSGAPDVVATRALRHWLATAHDGYVPDQREVARVLDVARGNARSTDLVGGARVERTAQKLRIAHADKGNASNEK